MVAVDESPAERGAPAEIAVECIVPNPRQPRQTFDEQGLAALADSIRQHGLVQPVVVQKAGPADMSSLPVSGGCGRSNAVA